MTTVHVLPPRCPFPPVQVAEPVALYRHLDQRGVLLYLGITSDPGRRWVQHLEASFWARFVATTYVQWFPDRAAAREAERNAIRHEEPIFNAARPAGARQHNDRKVAYLRTGRCEVPRRVPCTIFPAELCVACGPDLEVLYARVEQEMAG